MLSQLSYIPMGGVSPTGGTLDKPAVIVKHYLQQHATYPTDTAEERGILTRSACAQAVMSEGEAPWQDGQYRASS